MADIKPYVERSAGDFIEAEDWNKIQIEAKNDIQTHIQKHNHTGGKKGTLLTGKAIKSDSEVTLKNLSVENGFIMGFSPLFQKPSDKLDQEAVKVLQAKDIPEGTFLIGGPCKGNEQSFRLYWKTAKDKYKRIDIGTINMANLP